ncbi:MAG: response regulator [Clostridia bacterium]|nr:response regulator [Clostridia bacterium]
MKETLKHVDILLIEDNPGDVELAREALNSSKIRNTLNVVNDGVQAMDYLNNTGDYINVKRPDLILLDLNLPRIDGREVLKRIKSSNHLQTIPVVILTTSSAEADILKSYSLHANCYITKPLDFHQFMKVVKSIENFWMSIVVVLPPKED